MLLLKNKKDFFNKKIKRFNNNLIPLLLIVFYVTEAFSKITEQYSGEYSLLPRYIKLLAVGYIYISLILYQRTKFLKYLIVLVFIFIIGQSQLNCGFSFNSILIFGRYLFPISLFVFFTNRKTNINYRNLVFKSFETLILINSILIFLGFIFKIELFQTYNQNRFGYNGLFLTSATSTYVYITVIFYYLFYFNKRAVINWKIVVILSSIILIGTKSIYLIIFIISIYLFYKKAESKYKYWFVTLFILIVSLTAYLFLFKFGLFNEIRQNKGLLSAILSYRNELLILDTIPFIENNWNLLNYIFGGSCEYHTRSEMGFIDIVYFWGLLGGILYVWTFYKTYFTFKIDGLIKLLIFSLFIIISLAGNFFFYTTIPIYLLILKERILFTQENMGNED